METPDHYKNQTYECIDVMQAVGLTNDFYLGNAFKYLWRSQNHKDGIESNVKKARHYLEMWEQNRFKQDQQQTTDEGRWINISE